MFQRLLKRIASVLNKNHIPYMVIGGQAVLLYGEPRLTKDIEDVIIHKMIGKRPRDIEDAEAILLKNPEYDSRYIEKWLGEFDLALDKNSRKNFLDLKKDSDSVNWYND